MKMNVYDFDDTIYDGDSTLEFFKFCLFRKKRIILLTPIIVIYFLKYKLGIICKDAFKERFYSFLIKIENIDEMVELFWKRNHIKIKKWYLEQKQEFDVIVTASPLFLVEPICDLLGVNVIASMVDKNNGKLISKNCFGDEKVIRFLDEYPNVIIKEFYSDSITDLPLAKLALKSYFVNKNEVILWEDYVPKGSFKDIFLDKQFIKFLFVGVINVLKGVLFSYVFSRFLSVNIAFIVGYASSLTVSYFLNSFIVFKDKLSFDKYVKFVISYIPNFVIQLSSVQFFYHMLSLNELITYALAAVIATPITFLFLKFFAFKK